MGAVGHPGKGGPRNLGRGCRGSRCLGHWGTQAFVTQPDGVEGWGKTERATGPRCLGEKGLKASRPQLGRETSRVQWGTQASKRGRGSRHLGADQRNPGVWDTVGNGGQ